MPRGVAHLRISMRTAVIIPFPSVIFHVTKHFSGQKTGNLLASFLLLLRDIKVAEKNYCNGLYVYVK